MENPLNTFKGLPRNQKILVVVGVVIAVAGISYYRHKKTQTDAAAADSSNTDSTPADNGTAQDSTYADSPDYSTDGAGGVIPYYTGGSAALGGYGGLTPPVMAGDPANNTEPLNNPATGEPDRNVVINITPSTDQSGVASGGGPPNRPHPSVAHTHPGARHTHRRGHGKRTDHPSTHHQHEPHPAEHRKRTPVHTGGHHGGKHRKRKR